MTAAATALHALLAESVRLWRVPARVGRADDGRIEITGLGLSVTVTRAEPELPFRWLVTVVTPEASQPRTRPALSVVSVLRQMRIALDPGFALQRLRVAAPSVQSPDRP